MITAFVITPPPTAWPPMPGLVVAIGPEVLVAGVALLLALASASVVTLVGRRKRSPRAKLRALASARGAIMTRVA